MDRSNALRTHTQSRHTAEMLRKLYTIVCEFRGGTYCSQVRAEDETDAVRLWAEGIEADKPIPRASGFLARAALRDVCDRDYRPVALDGLIGAWCFHTSVGDDVALCNIVLTAE